MRVMFKDGLIILCAETDDERQTLNIVAAKSADHVFHLHAPTDKGLALHDLGSRADACGEPINIVSTMKDQQWAPISNLAKTPFTLNRRPFASIEGFWQGLKFSSEDDRARVAALHGQDAKGAAAGLPEAATIDYEGRLIPVGRSEHWALMHEACLAKFTQNKLARRALLATGRRPLQHRVRRDSLTIPGVIMADIWMQIRARLQEEAG